MLSSKLIKGATLKVYRGALRATLRRLRPIPTAAPPAGGTWRNDPFHFLPRKSRIAATVAAGCSSINQWPDLAITAPVTLVATKRMSSAIAVLKDFSAL